MWAIVVMLLPLHGEQRLTMEEQLDSPRFRLRSALAAIFPWMLTLFLVCAITWGLLVITAQTVGQRGAVLYNRETVVYDLPLVGHYALVTSYRRSASLAPNGPSPRLEIPRMNIDLGQIPEGQVAEHTFVIRNTGQGVLRVTRLYTTCPCLTAYLSASVIPPDRIALLTVRLDTAMEKAVAGGMVTIRRGVFLETNDSDWPQASLWIEATLSRTPQVN